MCVISALPVLDGLLSHLSLGSKGKGLSIFEGVDSIDNGETFELPFNAGSDRGDIEAARLIDSSSPLSCKARSAADGSGALARLGLSAGDNIREDMVAELSAA